MKKILFAVAAVMWLIMPHALADDISIEINNQILVTDDAPVIENDRTLVPMRAIFEGLGAKVSWDAENRAVYAERNGTAVRVAIGSELIKTGIVNSDGAMIFSAEAEFDVPARIINDRAFVPVRAVSEAFNERVAWDAENRRVIITTPIEGEKTFYYASPDDYYKLFAVDSNGVNRRKLSDRSIKELIYDGGYIYYIASDGFLYRQPENGGVEERLTDYDTEIVSIENSRIFLLERTSGILREYGAADYGYVKNPEKHGSYIYFNRDGDTRMRALNIDTYAETTVDMGYNITLAPYNCVFYNNYILVENGAEYHNIYRFNADGSDRIMLNGANSFICRNQEEDARVLYVNCNHGQDIYYLWIDGSYNGIVVDMPDDCAYADVLCQNGDYIYYKNMYRGEIYRTDFNNTETIYAGYGNELKIFGDAMIISGDGMFKGNPDGSEQVMIYPRAMKDYFAYNDNVYGIDSIFKNLVKTDYSGNSVRITNDRAAVWTDNILGG